MIRLRARATGRSLAALAFLALVATGAAAQQPAEPRSILLANRHLAPVLQVYLSAATDPDWGADRLGAATLAMDDDMTVSMEGGCLADLRIVFATGGAEERRAIDICETRRVVLRPGWTVAEALDEEGEVEPMPGPTGPNALRLRNAGPLPIVEIYTLRPGSPPSAPRGEDRLGADILPIGVEIDLEPTEPGACPADLVVVFRDGREVTRAGVDLCAGEEIEIR
jgi:hypothetical protein